MGITVIGTALKMHLNFVSIVLGKFLHGFGAAILEFLMGKAVNETVPNHLIKQYAIFPNIFLHFGYLIIGFISFLLPERDQLAALAVDNNWRIIYGYNFVFQLIGFITIPIFFRNPSLNQFIKEDNEEMALIEIVKIS